MGNPVPNYAVCLVFVTSPMGGWGGGGELQANKADRNGPPFLFLYPAALPDGDLARYTADGALGGCQWQVVGSVVHLGSVFSGPGIKATVLVSLFPQG